MPDVVVVGAGHNGLVAATLLARRGLAVAVLEDKSTVGGAARTEYPFAKAPNLGTSPGAYLLGVMPPELIELLGARLTLIRRDPHYFLPTLDHRFLLIGSDTSSMRRQYADFFSEEDWRASEALADEIGQIRDDLAPSWLSAPLSAEATAERYIRPALQRTFLELVTRPVEEYLARFGFRSDLLIAMHAVTDGFSGLHATFGTPGTGMNFLVHNMCRLPGASGTWMIVKGGMGAVTAELARLAREAGCQILTHARVAEIVVRAGRATGVVLEDGRAIAASTVVCNADPFRLRALVGDAHWPASFTAMLDRFRRTGTTMKVNLALDRLPAFRCLPEDRGQYRATIHLLPQGDDAIDQIRKGFAQAQAGHLAERPTIEWYTHTAVDPSLRDERGRHSAAFFVQWTPYELADSTWEAEEGPYVQRLIAIANEFAPGLADSVVDVFALTPKKIEEYFGMSYGHIHHVDNTFGFDQRMPYATPIEGLYSCSAGCHPAGSVIGCAGHNAAHRVLQDLQKD